MAEFTNTFSQGMDKDSSKNKYDNQHYYEAENVRVVTQNGLSSGALENLGGNKLRFSVGEGMGYIIGNVVLRDYLILWLTTNTGDPNTTSMDRICRIPLSRLEGLVADTTITLNTLWSHQTTEGYLVYEGHLGLSTKNKIKAVSRYENENIQKVYWIDGFNKLRHLNTIFNAEFNNLPYLAIDKLEVISNFTMTRPEFTGLRSGNLRSGRVQYTYQLYIMNGGETVFSPASSLVNIVEEDDFASSTINYKGSDIDVNTGKSVTGTINVTSLGYNRIRIVAIHYTSLNGDPTIRVIEERDISSGGDTITFTDSGQSLINYTLEEIRLLGTYLFIPKEIATKDNILFPANIKEESFDVDFDARAYRFAGASSQSTDSNYQSDPSLRAKSRIYNEDGNYYEGSGANPGGTWTGSGVASVDGWQNIPEEYDAINRFNDIDNDGSHAYRFMYQADGETLGGSGPHVSYKFKVKTIQLDDNISSRTILTGLESTVDNPSFTNYASPYQCAKYLGYARDEVYRFGIVFFDNKGRSSFVKWIGDIRMPSMSTLSNVDNYLADNSAPLYQRNNIQTVSVHSNTSVEYVLSVDSDPYKTSSRVLTTTLVMTEDIRRYAQWELLRRLVTDVQSFNEVSSSNINYDMLIESTSIGDHTVTLNMYLGHYTNGTWYRDTQIGDISPYVILTETQAYAPPIGGGNSKDFTPVFYNTSSGRIMANILYPEFTVNLTGTEAEGLSYQVVRVQRSSLDRSVRAQGIVTGTYADGVNRYPNLWRSNINWSPDVVCFNSPEVAFNRNLDRQANDRLQVVGTYTAETVNAEADYTVIKYKSIVPLPNFQTPVPASNLGDANYVGNSTEVITGSIVTMDNTVELPIGGYVYRRAMVDNTAFVKADKGTNFAAYINSPLWAGFYVATIARSVVLYKRNTFSYQYGGISYGSRTHNIYIPVGRIQMSDNAIIPVFDGDTYISMFDYLHAGRHEAVTDGIMEAVMFPVETSINLDLRMDMCYHNSYTTPNMQFMRESKGVKHDASDPVKEFVQATDMYQYNTVYSKENTSKLYLSRPYDWLEQKSFDVRILSSSMKINNEASDSWLKFGANSYLDVEPQYGEITALISYNNQMLFFQPKAFGSLSINERALLQTKDISALSLGTSGILARYDYAKTGIGTSHRDHIILTPNGLYWFDTINKNLIKFTGGPEDLSFMKGMSNWFRTTFSGSLTLSNILLYYDNTYKELGLVDSGKSVHLVYSEITDAFVSFYTYYPKFVISYDNSVYSSNDLINFYHHDDMYALYCKFYGLAKSPSSITFIVNPADSNVCTFTNLEWLTEVYNVTVAPSDNVVDETFTKLRVSNDYQDTGDITLVSGTTVKRRFRRWRHIIGRAIMDERGLPLTRLDARIRDSYVKIKLEFDNTNERRFVAHDLTTYFTIANK